jgi:hypothetical protein
MRDFHNLPTPRLTDETVNPWPARLALDLERLTTQFATSLQQHAASLSIYCTGTHASGRESEPYVGPERPPHKKAVLLFALLLLTAIGSGEHSPPVRIIKRPTDPASPYPLPHSTLHPIAPMCPSPMRTPLALSPQIRQSVNHVFGPTQPLRRMPGNDVTCNELARCAVVNRLTADRTRQLLPLQDHTVTAIPRRR